MLKKWLVIAAAFISLPTFANETAQKQMTFNVPEMYCQLCVYLVNKEVRNVKGVISSKASFKERNVVIVAEPQVQQEEIVKAIANLNYTATLVE